MLDLVGDWADYLLDQSPDTLDSDLHRHMRTGRPLGDDAFVDRLEQQLKRPLRPQKRGPKPQGDGGEATDLLSNPNRISN